MKLALRLKIVILQVVNDQLKSNNFPMTKQTCNRLIKEGCLENKAETINEPCCVRKNILMY